MAIDPIDRAMGYPYHIPDHAYLFENGHWRRIDWDDSLMDGRTAVLGAGSNRSPEQLARKYAAFREVAIPVERAWLKEFDTVYAAHITGYGSISATLQHVPGMAVEVSVTWLTPEQLARMDETEGRGTSYDLAQLDELDLLTEHGAEHLSAQAYIYRGGCLNDGGRPVGIAEIAARDRPHRALRQPDAQRLVHDRLETAGDAPGNIHTFVQENISDRALRARREAALQADALPFAWPHTRALP